MRLRHLLAVFLWCLLALPAQAAEDHCPGLLAEIGFDGTLLRGSKTALIAAVNRGDTIRVRWDLDFNDDNLSDLTHWSHARFISVWEGEVFTQVESIHRQSPVRGKPEIRLPSKTQIWHGLIDTTGIMRGKMNDSQQVGERRVYSAWCSAQPKTPKWTKVFQSGKQGETLMGSKTRLFDAIRAGEPIRVGWGLSRELDGETVSVEHVAEPVFLSITNGNQISAQLPEHLAPQSYWNADKAKFEDGKTMWRGLLSSTGTFDAIWADRASGDVTRRSPQRAIFSWYVLGGTPKSTEALAVPFGVISAKPSIE